MIGDPATVFIGDPVTVSPPSCEYLINYTIVYQNNDPLYNPPFTFDNNTRQLTIDSYWDSSVTGIHSLKYVVTNNHGGATLEDAFEVDI